MANSGDKDQAGSFYTVFGEYESVLRQKKLELAELEDSISHIQGKFGNLAKENEELERRIVNKGLEVDKFAAEFQRDSKKREKFEEQKQSFHNELEEWNDRSEEKTLLLHNIEAERRQKVEGLEENTKAFEVQYLGFRGVKEHIQSTSTCDKLMETLEEQTEKLEERRHGLLANCRKSKSNWVDFTKICIEIAKNRQEIRAKAKERNELKYRRELQKQTPAFPHLPSRSHIHNTKISDNLRRRPTFDNLTVVGIDKQRYPGAKVSILGERTNTAEGHRSASLSNLTTRLEQLRTTSPRACPTDRKSPRSVEDLRSSVTAPNSPCHFNQSANAAPQVTQKISMAPKVAGKVSSGKPHSVIAEYLKSVKQSHSSSPANHWGKAPPNQQQPVPKASEKQRHKVITKHQQSKKAASSKDGLIETPDNTKPNDSSSRVPMQVVNVVIGGGKERQAQDEVMETDKLCVTVTENEITMSDIENMSPGGLDDKLKKKSDVLNKSSAQSNMGSDESVEVAAVFKTPLSKNRPSAPKPSESFGFNSDFFSGITVPTTPGGASSDAYSLFGSPSSSQGSDRFQLGGEWDAIPTSSQAGGAGMAFLDLFGESFSSTTSDSSANDSTMSFF